MKFIHILLRIKEKRRKKKTNDKRWTPLYVVRSSQQVSCRYNMPTEARKKKQKLREINK